MLASRPFLSWLHFGDPHITRPEEQNYRDLLALVDAANRHLSGRVDFAVFPGDNADQGTAAQFTLVRDAIRRLSIPVHVLPGDHDFHTRSLAAFHDVLGASHLPRSEIIRAHRCVFLDVVSAGAGGPDFRLDQAQLNWLRNELEVADGAGQRVILFMHTYPADLRGGGDNLLDLLRDHHVTCVDMGHTHCNELANDGRTIFMATRSTGQIEEGPVGFSLAAIDRGVVSWRFKPLDEAWPLVMITSPADHRLIIEPKSPDQVVRGPLRIAAKVWGTPEPARVSASIDDGPSFPLTHDRRSAALWCAVSNETLLDGRHQLTVRAENEARAVNAETIIFLFSNDGSYRGPRRIGGGGDRDSIGAWPDKHLLGTQLGPDRNGREW